MKVTLRMQVIKTCPYRDETDVGELIVTVPGEAPELHQLADAVKTIAGRDGGVSHERFTAEVAALLPPGATASTTWRTGPWDVEATEDDCGKPPPIAAAGAAAPAGGRLAESPCTAEWLARHGSDEVPVKLADLVSVTTRLWQANRDGLIPNDPSAAGRLINSDLPRLISYLPAEARRDL